MHILIAPNAFKGSLTASEAARAMAAGVRRILPDAQLTLLPVADGGDGTLDVLVEGTGGQLYNVDVTDPFGRPIQALFGVLGDGTTAVIELASASGLRLLTPAERNPLTATTFGTGQLIRAALDAGCRALIIGIGGSATVDGGAGLAQATGVRLLDTSGNELPPGGAALINLHHIDTTGIDARLKTLRITVLCDVDNPLLSENGAARIFGPQKGATPEMVEQLEAALANFAYIMQRDTGIDVRPIGGGGAAGGVAAGMVGLFGARLQSGIDSVLETLNFADRLSGVDLVMTGEGSLDDQTIHGKAPAGVAKLAKQRGIPVVALAGSISGSAIYMHGIDAALPVVAGPVSLEYAMQNAAQLLEDSTERLMRLLQTGGRIIL